MKILYMKKSKKLSKTQKIAKEKRKEWAKRNTYYANYQSGWRPLSLQELIMLGEMDFFGNPEVRKI